MPSRAQEQTGIASTAQGAAEPSAVGLGRVLLVLTALFGMVVTALLWRLLLG